MAHRSLVIANPAVGQEFIVTVPAGKAWAIRCGSFQLVTDNTVQNRVVRIGITDGSGPLFQSEIAVNQAASSTFRYVFGSGLNSAGAASPILLSFPRGIVIPTGFTITSVTTLLAGGDQYSGIRILIDELEGDEITRSGTFVKLI